MFIEQLAQSSSRQSSWLRICRRTLGNLHLQQVARLGVTVGRVAVLAGSDAGQGCQVSPAEGWVTCGEFLGHRPVVLLGVEGAVFAYSVLQEQVEDRACRVAQFAVAVNQSAGTCLVAFLDRPLG